ncbi:hypothetical protein ABZU75_10600 [Streptosporangium sp. NPDC005286]|uniref:hypothetical protein n=1 Tax=Streptosporangium sp. NPDC005286 TaxID=3154463 RepID=UPI0033AE81A0
MPDAGKPPTSFEPCMALFGLTGAALSSLRAGLIDRYGPRRALPPKSPALLIHWSTCASPPGARYC